MFFVHPNDSERFALRMLLLYRKGCTSFQNLRTVNGTVMPTFKAACKALGYLEDDRDAYNCLSEAASFATAQQMRDLFVLILLNCTPANPKDLWDNFKDQMTHDILHQYRTTRNDLTIELNDDLYNVTLNMINDSLQKLGNHINNYGGMPELYTPIEIRQQTYLPSIIRDELNYDQIELNNFLRENILKLNLEQRMAYESIIDRFERPNQFGKNAFFIDGPGGTGKTFLYKLLLAKIRCQNKIALAVASSGIASTLLPGGRTGH